MSAINFVDYFRRRVNGATRVQFDSNLDRTSGEGTYLFANGLPIGMATPGDCQGIKMEFKYGVTATVTGTGKMAHGLDIKMTMDKDWDFTTRQDNATVRGARIQAVSEDDVSGRVTGAYINGRAEGTSKTIEGYSSAALHAGPGIIGIQARSEVAGTITGNAAGILVFHRNTTGATLTGKYTGIQIEKYMGTLGTVSSTVTGIYISDDWGGANAFTYGMDIKDGTCTTGIRIGNCTTGITLDGTITTGLSIATGCTTGISVTATTGMDITASTTGIDIGTATTGITFTGSYTTAISAATDHVTINTVTSSKNIRLNSQTYTTAASIVGVQVKPRYGVNMTDNIYGMEVEPGCSTGSTFTGKGITGIGCRPRMRGGNLSGDVVAYEGKLEYGDSGKTVALGSAVLKCILSSKRTFTQGVWPIYVTAKEDTTDWTSFALIPNDGVMAADGSHTCTTAGGWLKIHLGTAASNAAVYIQLYDAGTGG